MMAPSLAYLKATKNGIIGNPSRKSELARDGSITLIVEHLNPRHASQSLSSSEEGRIEAAHIVSSLSYGSREALKSLLTARLHHVLIYSLSIIQPSDSDGLVSALTRALKAFSTALADIVGPPLWGLHVEHAELKPDAVAALEEIFQVSSMDVWLPFLLSSATQVSISIAWVVASCVRHQRHRDAAIQWLPPADRSKETKGKRGWERPDIGNSNAPGRGGGWLVRNIIELYRCKDFKVQEAALSALAAVIKDSRSVVSVLRRPHTSEDALAPIIALIRSRHIDVQLAACLCATHMIRASPPPPLGPHGSPPNYDGSPALTIIHVLSDVIGSSMPSPIKTKACHILAALTRDEREIEKIAVDIGALNKVASLMVDLIPKDKLGWEEDEPEGTMRLREALLMAAAALTLQWDGVRRDLSSQAFFPCIHVCMSHPSVGVRYAACQCARVLCRSVSVLRTSVVDSGMGKVLFELIKNPDEDLRVRVAAMAGICNLLNDFSPMRAALLEQGAISTIVGLAHSEDKSLRLNSLWAIKNALFNAMLREKHMIIEELTWDFLAALLLDYDEEIREQAVNVVRNLADNDSDFVFEGLGPVRLAGCLESTLISPNESIVTQGLWAIANLGSGSPEYLSALIARPMFAEAIQNSLHHSKVDVRRAATSCVYKLVRRNVRELLDTGIENTLRNLTGRPVSLSGSSELQMGYESDREIAEKVKMTLGIIEKNKGFS
ncbi:ARM repeat-containing protein [Gautieria morchelliformis]|nr:ARM repeat-containing protein [Gautieria morchelliformis]